jgi:3-hydroxyisobutyrate dehydrogenase
MVRSAEPVGVIGVGRMGLGVAARLVASGFTVAVTDQRGQLRATAESVGARWLDSPAEIGGRCDRVLTVLPGAAEATRVRPELLSQMRPGSAWIDLSTSTPATARETAVEARRGRVTFLDSPMGGGPTEARDGGLTLFVGGDVDDLDAQRDITDAIATTVLHVGEVGAGCLVKLLVNLLWFGQALAGSEALTLAARAGLDPERVRVAVSHSAGASRFMDREAGSLLAGDDLESFGLAGCVEELHAVMALGRDHDVPLALGERVTAMYDAALERYGAIDGELLAARLVAERAGVNFAGDDPAGPGSPVRTDAP